MIGMTGLVTVPRGQPPRSFETVSHRLPKISETIRRELSRLMVSELEPPREMLLTITGVDVSVDLQNANVWMSVLPTTAQDAALAWLHRHGARLRAALFATQRFRPIPVLHFRADDTAAHAAEIEALIDRLPKSQSEQGAGGEE